MQGAWERLELWPEDTVFPGLDGEKGTVSSPSRILKGPHQGSGHWVVHPQLLASTLFSGEELAPSRIPGWQTPEPLGRGL